MTAPSSIGSSARGFRGSYQAARRYLTELRRTRPRGGPADAAADGSSGAPAPLARAAPVPTPIETAWLLRNADRTPDDLTAEEHAYVAAVCAPCPALARARTLVDEFVRLLKRHDAAALGPWLATAEQSELRAFAAGVRRDQDAVLAAVLFPWSNGQVEGHVHRIKFVKRSMFGRAGFRLLRARVLHHVA